MTTRLDAAQKDALVAEIESLMRMARKQGEERATAAIVAWLRTHHTEMCFAADMIEAADHITATATPSVVVPFVPALSRLERFEKALADIPNDQETVTVSIAEFRDIVRGLRAIITATAAEGGG